MQNKQHISIRIKESEERQGRICKQEWDEFKKLCSYFHKSADYLIESALSFSKLEKHERQTEYIFYKKKFVEQCNHHVGLEKLIDSLEKTILDKTIKIINNGATILIDHDYIPIYYFPPYIITFETSFETRVTLDLSNKLEIIEDENIITIINMISS